MISNLETRYGIKMILFLTTVQKYKKNLLSKHFDDKEKILITSFPRFLWIIRIFKEADVLMDLIYDATSTLLEKSLLQIFFKEKI